MRYALAVITLGATLAFAAPAALAEGMDWQDRQFQPDPEVSLAPMTTDQSMQEIRSENMSWWIQLQAENRSSNP